MGITVQALRDVRAGKVTFDAFVRSTLTDWRRVSRYAIRKWGLYDKLDPEDVLQDMLIGAWKAVSGFDPSRSKEQWLAHFVIFGAISYARKRHKVSSPRWVMVDIDQLLGMLISRKPKDHSTRLDPLLEVLSTSSREREVEVLHDVLSTKRFSFQRREALAAFLQQGSLRSAADCLYDDPDVRLRHEWMSRAQARRDVRKLVMKTVQSVTGERTAA